MLPLAAVEAQRERERIREVFRRRGREVVEHASEDRRLKKTGQKRGAGLPGGGG
jgi:hypothetical protein